MDDIRSVFELSWMRIASRFESFRGFIGLIGRLYLAFLAVLQVAMLLVSLTTMITIESVRVVFRAAEGLPWTSRIPCAVCVPFVGWLAARRVWHLEPTAIRVFESIAPARIAGIDRGLYGSALPEVLLQVPWGVGFGVFLLIAVVLTISWARRSRRAVEDARPA